MTVTRQLSPTVPMQVLFAGLAALSLATAVASAAPPIGVPADGRIVLTDYAGRNWGPELVRYAIDTARFAPGRLVLLDDNGKAVPFQIKTTDGKRLLMFIGAVPKGKSVTYNLQPATADRSRENSAIVNRAAGDYVEVGNEWLMLRLPRPQKQQFPHPVGVEKVPPPILGWKQAGYDWQGGFPVPHRAAGDAVRGSRLGRRPGNRGLRGPLPLPAGRPVRLPGPRVHRHPGSPGYRRVRFWQGHRRAGLPHAWPRRKMVPATDWLHLGRIAHGPHPAGAAGALRGEEIQRAIGAAEERRGVYPSRAVHARQEVGATGEDRARHAVGQFQVRLRVADHAGRRREGRRAVDVPHSAAYRLVAAHDVVGGLERSGPRRADCAADQRAAESLVPRHGRRPVAVQFARARRDLPPTYGRREWGLGFGLSSIGLARVQLGCIGLDRYKNWVLDWPENRSQAVYPAGLVTPAIAARVRQSLAQHPERELLEKLYIIDGKPETALDNAKRALEAFRHPSRGDEWQIVSISSYYTMYQHLWTIWANSALACPTLPADQRASCAGTWRSTPTCSAIRTSIRVGRAATWVIRTCPSAAACRWPPWRRCWPITRDTRIG